MRCFLLILLLSACSVAAAQTFKEGSVRLKGGQEQPGLIGEVRQGSPEGVEYKATSDGEIQLLYANDIEGYTVDKIFYSSYHQNQYRDREWVFAEILAEGELTLLRRNNMYFIRKKGSVEFKHLNNNHRVMLSKMTRNCPIVSVQIGKVSMDRKSLKEFIEEYNSCVSSKNPNLEGMPRVVSIGLQVGYDHTAASFRYNDLTKFLSATTQYDKSLLQGGIELNFKHYRVFRLAGLYAGILYNSNSYSGVNRAQAKTGLEVNEYSFSYKEIKVPVGLEISRPTTKKFTYHVRVGAVFPRVLSFKFDHPYTEISTGSGATITYAEPSKVTEYKPRSMWGGSIGLDYKISKSRVRIQGGLYSGKINVTATNNGSTANVIGKLTSINLMTTYIF